MMEFKNESEHLIIISRFGFAAIPVLGVLYSALFLFGFLGGLTDGSTTLLEEFIFFVSTAALTCWGFAISRHQTVFDRKKKLIVGFRRWLPFSKKTIRWDAHLRISLAEGQSLAWFALPNYGVFVDLENESGKFVTATRFKMRDLKEAEFFAEKLKDLALEGMDPEYTCTIERQHESWLPSGLERVLCLFGIPVRIKKPGVIRTSAPFTKTLMGLTAVVSIYIFFTKDDLFLRACFIPAVPWRFGGFTLVSYFFVHENFLHLLGNLYFFHLFGPEVEDKLKPFPYLLLILAATVGSCFAVIRAEEFSQVCHIGASGGIFGIMTFYFCEFPRSRFGQLLLGRWRNFPAWILLAVYSLAQLIGAASAKALGTNVSYWGHIGGGLTGVIYWLAYRLTVRGRIAPTRLSGDEPNN